ncbi:hypothetical protein DDI_1650 [Dickeya dianthicola RNS04.9]|nr:hypothetical protein DDI_1650 [Dickeya dianthicola RNS04.9]
MADEKTSTCRNVYPGTYCGAYHDIYRNKNCARRLRCDEYGGQNRVRIVPNCPDR